MDVNFLKQSPIAHRGYFDNQSLAPENSLAACRAAIGYGFAIEVDVMLTLDGTVVVFHDDTLMRMCGSSRKVTTTTFKDLSSYKLLNSPEKIPTLRQLLDTVAGQVPLVIELKSFEEHRMHVDGKLEAAVLKELSKYRGPVALKSFNPESVTLLKKLGARCPVGFLSLNYAKDKEFYYIPKPEAVAHTTLTSPAAVAADFISYSISDLTDEISKQIRPKKPLIVWTVRTEEQFHKAEQLADNVVFEWRGVRPLKT